MSECSISAWLFYYTLSSCVNQRFYLLHTFIVLFSIFLCLLIENCTFKSAIKAKLKVGAYVVCPYCDPNYKPYPNVDESCRGYDVPMGNPMPSQGKTDPGISL